MKEIDVAFRVPIGSRSRTEDGGMDGLQPPLSHRIRQASEEARSQRGQDQHSFRSDVITVERVEEGCSSTRLLDMHEAMIDEAPERQVARILGGSCETGYFSVSPVGPVSPDRFHIGSGRWLIAP